MSLGEPTTYYEVLDLKPDASAEEIREAYLRTKTAFNKDSLALYTLMEGDETRDLLRRVEEAYSVLSNADRRREYDRHHGLLSLDPDPAPASFGREAYGRAGGPPKGKGKVVSIDRVPPMETLGTSGNDDLLIAPATDFGGSRSAPAAPPPPAHVKTPAAAGAPAAEAWDPFALAADAHRLAPAAPSAPASPPLRAVTPGLPESSYPTVLEKPDLGDALADLTSEITREVEWRGHFLRKIREARRVSIEEMSAVTKISKTYLIAIEEENFARLPAAVYLRGFVIQVAKVLRIPEDRVAPAYMARYYQARPSRER